MARLREEVLFYQLDGLMNQLATYFNLKYPTKNLIHKNTEIMLDVNNGNNGCPIVDSLNVSAPTSSLVGPSAPINPLCETGKKKYFFCLFYNLINFL